jgi:hypothetical protein
MKYKDVVLQNYAVGYIGTHRTRRTLCDFIFSHIDPEQETRNGNSVTMFEETLKTQCNMSRNPVVCGKMIACMPYFVNLMDMLL